MSNYLNFSRMFDFKALKISLASPEEILSWSNGEVTKPETINYRTLKPEKDGLFCERIFGPSKDWECYCGKYKRIRFRGIICDKCGVEVTLSKVRRERMGHISLAAPVVHVWFFKGAPSKLSLLLDISPRNIESVIYFASYLVIDFDKEGKLKAIEALNKELEKQAKEIKQNLKKQVTSLKKQSRETIKKLRRQKAKTKEQVELKVQEVQYRLSQESGRLKEKALLEADRARAIIEMLIERVKKIKKKSLLTEEEYLKLAEFGATDFFEAKMGAEAILELIKQIDLGKIAAELRTQIKEGTRQKKVKAIKRLKIINGLLTTVIDPSWMIIKVLPVIPPDLRPMVQLSGGRFATSDLNDLYRRVINRNNRLKHLIELGAPEIILKNEKRMLQESIDGLMDVSQRGTVRRRRGNKVLRSLSDMLHGKQGRFRQNLLGKRVDYSGRSVIVVGPELLLNQCGLPKEMALEMFKPFVLREMIKRDLAPNVKNAKRVLETRPAEVFDILEEITKNHPILLNRAPTLHKLGIQAFFPILIEGSAISIHPCVCAGYNADFDGDQMAVHIPLSKQALREAAELMTPAHNLLKPADGSPINLPNKEMALGCFYLTSVESDRGRKTDNGKDELKKSVNIYSSSQEAVFALQTGKIRLRQLIKVRLDNKQVCSLRNKLIETTCGRIIFNEHLPEDLSFINQPVTAGKIKEIVIKALKSNRKERVSQLIDDIKMIGFTAATEAGISVGLWDNVLIPQKKEIIEESEKEKQEVERNFNRGLITESEKRRLSNDIWLTATDKIAALTWSHFDENNSVRIIIDSGGSRATKDQVKQLSAMRGLVVDPLGNIVPMPTKSNFREGLSIFEYVTSTRGSRKGLTDSALKTADAGYLTRRLVDVSHDAIIRLNDCGVKQGMIIKKGDKRQVGFEQRLVGRVVVEDILVKDGKKNKLLLRRNQVIDEDKILELSKYKIETVKVRSVLNCQARYGLCQWCYGWDLSQKKMVDIGTPVGVIAAQSIGEPGTQLTMRVRHTGGIVGLDVTQGLPRVEELFEARTPKILSPMSNLTGLVKIDKSDESVFRLKIRGKINDKTAEQEIEVPKTQELVVNDGDLVAPGSQLASGFLDIKEVLFLRGIDGVRQYLINEIQKVYESQGIPINDKHFEVVVRKMTDKVKISHPGDSGYLPGELVDKSELDEKNKKLKARQKKPARVKRLVLGITRASLYTNSWLSAASFQATTNVLTEASLLGKEDSLIGLKENVIIGRLIPTTPERAMINRT